MQPGDTVWFLATDPGHNAAIIAGMISEGGEKFIGKFNDEIEVTLDAEGVWGTKCSPHYTTGDADPGRRRPASEADPAAQDRMLKILARRDASS